jgi:hypothetical protein
VLRKEFFDGRFCLISADGKIPEGLSYLYDGLRVRGRMRLKLKNFKLALEKSAVNPTWWRSRNQVRHLFLYFHSFIKSCRLIGDFRVDITGDPAANSLGIQFLLGGQQVEDDVLHSAPSVQRVFDFAS